MLNQVGGDVANFFFKDYYLTAVTRAKHSIKIINAKVANKRQKTNRANLIIFLGLSLAHFP